VREPKQKIIESAETNYTVKPRKNGDNDSMDAYYDKCVRDMERDSGNVHTKCFFIIIFDIEKIIYG